MVEVEDYADIEAKDGKFGFPELKKSEYNQFDSIWDHLGTDVVKQQNPYLLE